VPLLLAPVWDEKTWGGRRLELLGKSPPPGQVGESLETGPLSTVLGGPFDGRLLGDLARTKSAQLLGRRGMAAAQGFADVPLLIKFIDAKEALSVQVHPSDELAPPGKRGKTEAWLIIAADPGARIVTGVTGPIEIERISEQLVETTVRTGDIVFVPAGTVHAIGAGVLLYEVQQASDVTFRLYDWGRPREIHVDAALAAANPELRATPVTALRIDAWRETLVACRHFVLERWIVSGNLAIPASEDTPRILTVLDGRLVIDSVEVPRGATALLPADLPPVTISGAATTLVAYVPDLNSDVVQPLLAAGHSHEAIKGLGADFS
jgi:mannose-6-phosphate isomerase